MKIKSSISHVNLRCLLDIQVKAGCRKDQRKSSEWTYDLEVIRRDVVFKAVELNDIT